MLLRTRDAHQLFFISQLCKHFTAQEGTLAVGQALGKVAMQASLNNTELPVFICQVLEGNIFELLVLDAPDPLAKPLAQLDFNLSDHFVGVCFAVGFGRDAQVNHAGMSGEATVGLLSSSRSVMRLSICDSPAPDVCSTRALMSPLSSKRLRR